MFRPGDYDNKSTFNKPSYNLSTNDIEGAQPKSRVQYALRNSQRLGGAGAAIMDPSIMDPAGADKVPMGQGSKGVSDIFNQGEKYVPKNQRDALTTHDINGGVKKNAYGAVMTMEDRLKDQTAGGFIRKPMTFQENLVPIKQGQGRNASQILIGEEMKSMPQPSNNENIPPPHMVLNENFVRNQQQLQYSQEMILKSQNKSLQASIEASRYPPAEMQSNPPMQNGIPPTSSVVPEQPDPSRFSDKYGSAQKQMEMPPRQHQTLPSYQEMRASAYKDKNALMDAGGAPPITNMYQPLDMNKLKENLPTGGNQSISANEQRMLDQMMQDYYKDRKYNSGISGKDIDQLMPSAATAAAAQPPSMHHQQLPPYEQMPQMMSMPNNAGPGVQPSQLSQKEVHEMMKQKEQEQFYHEWKKNPIQDYQTIKTRSQPSSEMGVLQVQRQRSHQEQSLSGLGYGRANSINSKEMGQERLDQKYKVKDFSHEDHTGWIDPRAGKFSSVALQAQGHQLPPLPKPKITPYPKGLSIIQDPNYMNSMQNPQNQQQRRSLRQLKNNKIEDQKRVERSFYKPGVTPTNLDELYFKVGEKRSPGRRIQANKNYSSQERTFGLDYSVPLIQSADHGERQRGASPDKDPNTPFQGGKRQYGVRNNSQRNLFNGQYGYDPIQGSPNRNKPYSKHQIAIDKPQMYADGQNLPIEKTFKQSMNRNNPIL